MKRRSFIHCGIAATITVPTSLAPTEAVGTPSVRVGIMDGTLGLATNPEAVRYAAALGFESVQVTLGQPAGGRLPLSDPALQKQWRDAATRYKIKLSATYIDVLHTDCLKSSAQASAWIEEGLHATTALQAPILMLVFFGKCALNTDAEQQAILEPLRQQAGLVISEQPVARLDVSEAEVIRRIFRMAAEERHSCGRIADYLNALGVPSAGTTVGDRHKSTSGKWRAGRVRNLLISTVYKGQHIYGKRSRNLNRSPIVRSVPAIVSAATWQQAQATLQQR